VKTQPPLFKFLFLSIGFLSAAAGAQNNYPDAPRVWKKPPNQGANNYLYQGGWVCGMGASHSPVATTPTVQCGGMFTFTPFFNAEVGVMAPQANQSTVSGYLSTNFVLPLAPADDVTRLHGLPLLVGGYTRMFETGHALDYGVAFTRPVDESHSIQFEVRDYWAFSKPSQHNVVFRVMWITGIPD
jgi:hypothetical protein